MRYVEPANLDKRPTWDAECDICDCRGGGNPCGNCREMAALALGGNVAAAAALASFGADFAAVRSAVKAHRERTLLQRVAEMGRAL